MTESMVESTAGINSGCQLRVDQEEELTIRMNGETNRQSRFDA